MSRLVSAFQDKVVDRYNIRKPKKAAKKFRQFVEKLVARAGEQCPAPNRCGKMNKHWRPYISRWRHFVFSQQGGILSFHPQVWVLRCPVQSHRPGGDCAGGPTVYWSHGKCGVPENR